MEEAEVEAEAEDGVDDKLDMWSLDRLSVLEAGEDYGTGMAEASEVLWGKDLAVCTDSGGSIRRCYASAENRNIRLDTEMKPLPSPSITSRQEEGSANEVEMEASNR